METPAQTGTRLLAALEDLVIQEATAVHAADYEAVASLQQRTAAVGEKLGELAGEADAGAWRARVEALIARRHQSQQVLAQRLAAGRVEMQRLLSVRQRLTRLAPAYGVNGGAASRLNAAA